MYEGEDIEDEPEALDDDLSYWETPEGIAESARQFAAYMRGREIEESAADMPAHQRPGYAEGLAEQADMRRKEMRENGDGRD